MSECTENSSRKKFTLVDLLREQSRDLFDAECRHRETVAKLVGEVVTPDLADYLSGIANDADENVQNLTDICAQLKVSPTGVECAAMAGLVREAKESHADWSSSCVRDAAIISNEQRMVHYQIAGFGTALAFSRTAKLNGVAEVFSGMLDRAKANDKALTKIACGGWLDTGVNQMALAGE